MCRGDVTTDSFGARLRHERERRGIALSSIADRTKIAPALLVALERGDLSRWPGGLYRRAFIRAYAEAVGLDPNEVVRELLEYFPDPTQTAPPIDAAGQPSPDAASSVSASAMVRLRIDPTPHLCRGGPILSDARHRLGAIGTDLAIFGVISMGFGAALEDFWMPLAIAMAGYYAGGILILGNTPGVCLSAAFASADSAQTEASHNPT
jgi:transcriptional regulator with XRE-family HTH domain